MSMTIQEKLDFIKGFMKLPSAKEGLRLAEPRPNFYLEGLGQKPTYTLEELVSVLIFGVYQGAIDGYRNDIKLAEARDEYNRLHREAESKAIEVFIKIGDSLEEATAKIDEHFKSDPEWPHWAERHSPGYRDKVHAQIIICSCFDGVIEYMRRDHAAGNFAVCGPWAGEDSLVKYSNFVGWLEGLEKAVPQPTQLPAAPQIVETQPTPLPGEQGKVQEISLKTLSPMGAKEKVGGWHSIAPQEEKKYWQAVLYKMEGKTHKEVHALFKSEAKDHNSFTRNLLEYAEKLIAEKGYDFSELYKG